MRKPTSSGPKYLISKIILATVIYFALVFMSQPFLPEIIFYNILGFSIFLLLFIVFIVAFRSVLTWFEERAKRAINTASKQNSTSGDK